MSGNADKKAVVILGAGASVPFGLPALRDFFAHKKSIEFLNSQDDKKFKDDLEKHFWKIRGCSLETSNKSITIEEILTLLREMEYQNKKDCEQRIFCDFDPETTEYTVNQKCKIACEEIPEKTKIFSEDLLFYEDFRKNIYCLMEHVLFTDVTSSQEFLNPLINFCDSKFPKTLWATYNWDCIFESSFYYSRNPHTNPHMIMDATNWKQGNDKHELIKLHGGINYWLDKKESEIPRYLSFSGASTDKDSVKGMWSQYKNSEIDENGYSTKGKPLILEPSYYKYDKEKIEENWRFRECWCYFLNAMIEADFIFVVGYCLPEADQKARSALMIASQINIKAKWIVVNPSIETCTRYEQLLGSYRTYLFCKSLENFNDEFISTGRLWYFLSD